MDCFITAYNIDCPPDAKRAVLDDSIMHKGHPVTAGSKILENFISPIDAEVVTRIEAADVKILGKTKTDEFGIAGLVTEASAETSGAVSAVADGIASFALCNDLTGSIGQQAAARGIYYIHPTYGTVSRFGLIPSAPSMDQIGIVCKTPQDGFDALSIIAGHDPKDGAMRQNAGFYGAGEAGEERAGKEEIVIGIPGNVLNQTEEKTAVIEFAKNFDTVEFELMYFDVYKPVMQILCFAEISNNISRYDGIKYGYRAENFANLQELYTKSRTEAFGADAKLAAIMGAMVLSQENYTRYYDKAMRIRRLIRDSLEFDKYDVIIMPASGAAEGCSLAYSALPRLCGLPAVTVPSKAGATTLIANENREDILFSTLKKEALLK